jgi:hypothetical protein
MVAPGDCVLGLGGAADVGGVDCRGGTGPPYTLAGAEVGSAGEYLLGFLSGDVIAAAAFAVGGAVARGGEAG